MRVRLGIAVLFVFAIALWLAAVWVVMFKPKFFHLLCAPLTGSRTGSRANSSGRTVSCTSAGQESFMPEKMPEMSRAFIEAECLKVARRVQGCSDLTARYDRCT